MIRLSNGHSFEFMAASGALAFDGRGWPWEWPLRWTGLLDPSLFTIVVKTLTRHPRPGNLRWTHPWSVIKNLRGGVVNAIGLTNGGIEWWLEVVAPTMPRHYHIIVSLEGNDPGETVDMVHLLKGQKIRGIELNLSCPNTESTSSRSTETMLQVCHTAAKASPFPVIAKLSYAHDYRTIVQGLKGSGIQAISINSIPWSVIYPGKKSPLAKFGGGGVSGKIAQPYTWEMIREIAKISKIPVIGPSVWDYEDIQKIFDLGASAVSFGSIFVSHPWKPTAWIKQWYLQKDRRPPPSRS